MEKFELKPKLLITGVAGGLAQLVVDLLARKYRLVGIDPRPLPDGVRFPGEFASMDYRSRKLDELFRQHEFHAVLHLGRLPLGYLAKDSDRFNVNVLGTRHLLELCARHRVQNVVVCSSFHVYGAHPHNPLYLSEDDPLRASHTFPELVDAVELDNTATAFLLKHPEIRVVVLRPCNVIGPSIRNRISTFLRSRFCPYSLGFDPPMQFLHEADFARAVKLALECPKRGVYNVAGEGVVPFTHAIRIAGAKAVPFAQLLVSPLGLPLRGLGFPLHLADYFRFPVVISDQPFRREFGFRSQITTRDALNDLRSTGTEEE